MLAIVTKARRPKVLCSDCSTHFVVRCEALSEFMPVAGGLAIQLRETRTRLVMGHGCFCTVHTQLFPTHQQGLYPLV